jgi:hypothetical protein
MMEQMWIGRGRVVNCRLEGIPKPRHPSNSSSGWLPLTSAQLSRKSLHLEKSFIGHKMRVSYFSTIFVQSIFHSDTYLATYTRLNIKIQAETPDSSLKMSVIVSRFYSKLAVPGHVLLWLSLVKWKRKKRESARF